MKRRHRAGQCPQCVFICKVQRAFKFQRNASIFPYFTSSAGDACYSGSIHATQVYGDSQRYNVVTRMPLATLISPRFLRRREDKTVTQQDIRIAQVTDVVDVPCADKDLHRPDAKNKRVRKSPTDKRIWRAAVKNLPVATLRDCWQVVTSGDCPRFSELRGSHFPNELQSLPGHNSRLHSASRSDSPSGDAVYRHKL